MISSARPTTAANIDDSVCSSTPARTPCELAEHLVSGVQRRQLVNVGPPVAGRRSGTERDRGDFGRRCRLGHGVGRQSLHVGAELHHLRGQGVDAGISVRQ